MTNSIQETNNLKDQDLNDYKHNFVLIKINVNECFRDIF